MGFLIKLIFLPFIMMKWMFMASLKIIRFIVFGILSLIALLFIAIGVAMPKNPKR